MKYVIDYGCGIATLYTETEDWKSRFYELANTCFGIRKSIMCANLKESSNECVKNKYPDEYERLEFNGDVYIWRKDGAKRMIEPEFFSDEEWDESYVSA